MLKTRSFVMAACVAILFVPSAYGAFSMNYLDFSGTTVDYLAVTESNTGATATFWRAGS